MLTWSLLVSVLTLDVAYRQCCCPCSVGVGCALDTIAVGALGGVALDKEESLGSSNRGLLWWQKLYVGSTLVPLIAGLLEVTLLPFLYVLLPSCKPCSELLKHGDVKVLTLTGATHLNNFLLLSNSSFLSDSLLHS